MRILVVAARFAPEFEGGSERVARAQARELARRGHAVRVLAGTAAEHAGRDLVAGSVDGLEVLRLPLRADERFDQGAPRPRVDALAAQVAGGCDAALVHHTWSLSSGLVRALARRARTVAVLHDFFAVCPRFFRRSPEPNLECPAPGDLEPCARCLAKEAQGADLEGALRRRAQAQRAELASAAVLVAPSRAHARELERLAGLGAGSIQVVAPGCSWSGGAARRARTETPRAAGPRVLRFGNLCAQKGTLDLVDSLAGIAGAELDLAGRALEPGFEDEVRRRAHGLVTFHGAYEGDRPPALVALAARADLAAFPSRLPESYGLAVDEALSLGLPAWVSDGGAPAERLADLGLPGRVLPARDPASWRAAFQDLARDRSALAGERERVPARLAGPAEAIDALERLLRAA